MRDRSGNLEEKSQDVRKCEVEEVVMSDVELYRGMRVERVEIEKCMEMEGRFCMNEGVLVVM